MTTYLSATHKEETSWGRQLFWCNSLRFGPFSTGALGETPRKREGAARIRYVMDAHCCTWWIHWVSVCVVSSVVSSFLRPHGLYPTRLLCPWKFPVKNPGVGCHLFLQGSSRSSDQTYISCIRCIGRWILYHRVFWEAQWILYGCTKQNSVSERKYLTLRKCQWKVNTRAHSINPCSYSNIKINDSMGVLTLQEPFSIKALTWAQGLLWICLTSLHWWTFQAHHQLFVSSS